MDTTEVVIKTNKLKIAGFIALSLFFVVLGVWVLFYVPVVKILSLNISIFLKSIGFFVIAFFGTIAGVIFKEMFNKPYGIKINEKGIYDNSSVINSGLIKWENIDRIEVDKIHNQNLIRIIVNNPNYFINRQKFFLAKKM